MLREILLWKIKGRRDGAEKIESYLFNRAVNRLPKLKEQLQQEIGRNIHAKIMSLSYYPAI
jgi:hypothetical protein